MESGIHGVESRIQECLGFPYMGRKLTDMIDNPQNRSSLYLYISAQAALQPQNMPDYGTVKTRNTRLTQRNNKGKQTFYSLGVFT